MSCASSPAGSSIPPLTQLPWAARVNALGSRLSSASTTPTSAGRFPPLLRRTRSNPDNGGSTSGRNARGTGSCGNSGGGSSERSSDSASDYHGAACLPALGIVALVNFWASAAFYIFLGLLQKSFTYSVSRLVTVVVVLTLSYAFMSHLSPTIIPVQTLLWGGNLIYLGALCGWAVADAFR